MPIGIYVHGASSHVSLARNHVHSMGNYNGTLGSFDINAHGIAVYGDRARHPITDVRISHNEVDHLRLGASESVVVNGNVDHWRITHNRIHDNNNIGIDAIGFEPTLSGPARYSRANRARDGVIADNVIRNIISRGNPAYFEDGGWCNCADGIYIDGGTGIRVERNRVVGNDIGIEVAAENARGSADHVVVADNFITRSGYVGIATGGYCDGADDCGGVETGRAFANRFLHNTLYAQQPVRRRVAGDPGAVPRLPAPLIQGNIVRATGPAQPLIGTVPRAQHDAVGPRAASRRQPLLRRGGPGPGVVRRPRCHLHRLAELPERHRPGCPQPVRRPQACGTPPGATSTSAPARPRSTPASPCVPAGWAGATSTASTACRVPGSTSVPTSAGEPRRDRPPRPPDHDLATEGVTMNKRQTGLDGRGRLRRSPRARRLRGEAATPQRREDQGRRLERVRGRPGQEPHRPDRAVQQGAPRRRGDPAGVQQRPRAPEGADRRARRHPARRRLHVRVLVAEHRQDPAGRRHVQLRRRAGLELGRLLRGRARGRDRRRQDRRRAGAGRQPRDRLQQEAVQARPGSPRRPPTGRGTTSGPRRRS